MRQKLLTYTLLAAVAGAVFWACQRDRFGHGDPNAVEPTLTVNEARDFFEYQFSETMPYLTKLPQDRPVGMMPGDFTPLWDKARIGANREMDGADVPIDPKFIFVAVFNQITPQGDTVRRTVDVIQKLVVKKWRDTREYEAFCYIASIVPTPEYHARHKNVGKEFRYAGSKGVFSGFVVYQTLEGIPVAITNYQNGNATRHEYFPRISRQNVDSVAVIMDEIMEGVAFQAGTPAMFGLGTEENPWTPDEEITITAKRNSSQPWLITIALHPPRPTGLPTGFPNPGDITYVTPNVPSGGGGDGGNSPSLSGQPKNFNDDCGGNKVRIKTAAGDLLNIMKNVQTIKTYNTPTFKDFMQRVEERPAVEHSMVLKADFNSGDTYFGHIRSAVNPDDFVDVENNTYTIGIVHSHPLTHQTPPSALDVVDLGGQLAEGNNDVQASYVIVGNDIYCLQVTDPAKARTFAAANPTTNNGEFNITTPAGRLWQTGFNRMSSMDNFNDRYCAAMAYVLDRADAGITLMRMKSGSKNFESYGVKTNDKGDYYPTRCR